MLAYKRIWSLILQKEVSDGLFLSTYFVDFIISFESEVTRLGLLNIFLIFVRCAKECVKNTEMQWTALKREMKP